MPAVGFHGMKVLSLESRRAVEMGRLIENYSGKPISAPAVREVPVAHNEDTLVFARALIQGQFDLVIFLTGVGARALLQTLQEVQLAESFLQALRGTKIAVRGPKPLAVLREWNVPVAVTAPEPCTWRELLSALVETRTITNGLRVVVQAYGVSNPELLESLRERGAVVQEVSVYQWELPTDVAPLRTAVSATVENQVDVALFTTGVQAMHLFRIAEEMGQREQLLAALHRVVVGSIGPATSETLQNFGVHIDLESSHPKMGVLVKEAAEYAAERSAGKAAS